MNIKVITRHAPSNYGSLLQSIATQTILERLGHNCDIIDYQPKIDRGIRKTISIANKQGYNKNILKKIAYVGLRYPEDKIALLKFDRMRKMLLHLTQRCVTHQDLQKIDADLFMTGSDQVWGLMLDGKYDSAYFLSFVKDKPKVAYSASFGRTDFTRETLNEYKKLLSSYAMIAVREDTAIDTLKKIGIPCAGHVLDPTLLLDDQNWSRLIKNKIKGEYVLIYQLHKNSKMDHYAKKFAENVGLQLVRISPTLHQISRGGKFVFLPDVNDFLSYIKNCTYFITDSFHGTAFALIFNKQFIEILPNNKTDSRNQSILRLTQLQDRILSDYQDFSFSEKKIDYTKVNIILNRERKKSIEILNDILRVGNK